MLFIQCIVFCILFTLIILPAQYKNPISMIASYPPKIIQRVESLTQYKGDYKKLLSLKKQIYKELPINNKE